jgi:hypothetical protein
MDNNKLDYESTSEDNTSIEENERIVKLTKRASSKYINPNPRKINQPIKVNINSINQTTNISTDIRKMVKVSTSTLLLIKCRK